MEPGARGSLSSSWPKTTATRGCVPSATIGAIPWMAGVVVPASPPKTGMDGPRQAHVSEEYHTCRVHGNLAHVRVPPVVVGQERKRLREPPPERADPPRRPRSRQRGSDTRGSTTTGLEYWTH